MKITPLILLSLILWLPAVAHAASAFKVTEEWKQRVRAAAPGESAVAPAKERKVLIFSLTTGFKHWCIPHTAAMVEILGEESGAYTAVDSMDIEVFLPENLKQYDAVILNNNCPDRKDRDVFRDVLINQVDQFGQKYADMPEAERVALAEKLYQSMVDYVSEGGGLVLLHGAIANFSKSDHFSAIAGGSFNFHPKQQDVTLIPVNPDHSLLKPFEGKPFTHFEEAYFMNRAYEKLDFQPLLEIDVSKLNPDKRLEKLSNLPRYAAWIKPHGKGRVFFCSPSHNAQSFERPELLGFILNGIQYAIGDLEADDTTPAR
ncbi:MAG: ThuA domain-containing protein [Verrucomicrobiota bacterium]